MLSASSARKFVDDGYLKIIYSDLFEDLDLLKLF